MATNPVFPSTAIEICNASLAKLGGTIITDFDDGATGLSCKLLYEPLVRGMLTKHPWRFAKLYKFALDKLTWTNRPDDSTWSTKWSTPDDMLERLRVYVAGHAYALYRDRDKPDASPSDKLVLLSNVTTKEFIDYTARITESLWPPYFTIAAIDQLSQLLAIPQTGQGARKQSMVNDGVVSWASAVYADSMQQPSEAIQQSPFITARFGGR